MSNDAVHAREADVAVVVVARSAVGVVGAVVSGVVTITTADGADMLPAASIACTV